MFAVILNILLATRYGPANVEPPVKKQKDRSAKRQVLIPNSVERPKEVSLRSLSGCNYLSNSLQVAQRMLILILLSVRQYSNCSALQISNLIDVYKRIIILFVRLIESSTLD